MATLYESYGLGGDWYYPQYGATWYAQNFTPAVAHTITSVKLTFKRTGTIGTLTVGIRATTADKPSGADLASGTYDVSAIDTVAYAQIEVTLGAGYALVAGTKYAIVCRINNGDAGNYLMWRADTDLSGGGYAGGSPCASTDSGGTWGAESATDEFYFEDWGTANVTVIPSTASLTLTTYAPTVTAAIDTLYESYITGDDNYEPVYGSEWFGQTFTPSISHTIKSVKIKASRVGLPGTVTVSIRATAAGLPTGSDLVSNTTDGDTFATGSPYEWREITLGNGVALLASTVYAIVVRVTGAGTGNSLRWRDDATSPTYAGGSMVYSSNSGSTWTAYTGEELLFEEWGAVNTVVIPGTVTLTLTTYAPTITGAQANVTVTPGVASLTLTTYAPTILGTTHIVSGYAGGDLTSSFDFTLTTHVILERLIPISSSNLTLTLDGITAGQINTQVAAIHAAGSKAVMDIFTSYTGSAYNDALAVAARRAELIASCVSLQSTYNLDGFDFDWESDYNSNWSNANFDTLIAALYAALPVGQRILSAAVGAGKLSVNASTITNYMHHVGLMCYDGPWMDPDRTSPVYHPVIYGNLADSAYYMEYWRDSGGVPANKLVMGARTYWYNWIAWKDILAGSGLAPYGTIVVPADADNSTTCAAGTITGTGFDLMKAKAQWVKDNGFGGMFLYTLNGDDLGAKSFTQAINTILTIPPATTTTTYVVPGTASLVLATYAPTVVVGANVTVTPSTAVLTLTAYAPSVYGTTDTILIPGTAALLLTTYAPTILMGRITNIDLIMPMNNQNATVKMPLRSVVSQMHSREGVTRINTRDATFRMNKRSATVTER